MLTPVYFLKKWAASTGVQWDLERAHVRGNSKMWPLRGDAMRERHSGPEPTFQSQPGHSGRVMAEGWQAAGCRQEEAGAPCWLTLLFFPSTDWEDARGTTVRKLPETRTSLTGWLPDPEQGSYHLWTLVFSIWKRNNSSLSFLAPRTVAKIKWDKYTWICHTDRNCFGYCCLKSKWKVSKT